MQIPPRLINVIRRNWISGVGLIVAVFAFLATQQYAKDRVDEERSRLMPEGGLVEVLVAARNLDSGEKLDAEKLAIRQVPRQWVLPDTISPDDFNELDQSVLTHSVRSGGPITRMHVLASSPTPDGLSLEAGFTAISIPVDEVSSLGGLIQPGDRIDLWMPKAMPVITDNAGGFLSVATDQAVIQRDAQLIASNLRVLAAGQRTERRLISSNGLSASPYASLTLAVPEEIAAQVLGGQLQGRLSIALRSPQQHRAGKSERRSSSGRAVPSTPVEILIGGLEGATP
jgi:pilus assembly protein CpaB